MITAITNLIRITLWKLGVVKILPRAAVNRIPVRECGEVLVRCNTSQYLRPTPITEGADFVREGIARRLEEAACRLPPEFNLVLVEGFRSNARQAALWNERLRRVQQEHPDKAVSEQERIARLYIAQPNARGSGHQTGGAVDVTLCYKDGRLASMGTALQEFLPQTPSFCRSLPPEILANRDLLYRVMKESGFENYPGEWWHFSFGDQMWAAYGNHREAIYGPVMTS